MIGTRASATSRPLAWLFAAAWLVAPLSSVTVYRGFKAVDVLLLLSLVATALLERRPSGAPFVFVPLPARRVLLGLVLIALGTLIGAVRIGGGAGDSAVLNALWAAAPLILLLRTRADATLRVLLAKAFVLGVGVSVTMALLDRAGAVKVTGRWQGLTTHPNQLAMTIVLALPLVPLLFSRVRQRVVLAVVVMALLLFTLVQTGSRSGAIGAVIVLGLMLVRWSLGHPWRVMAAVCGALVVLAVVASVEFTPSGGTDLISRAVGASQDVAKSDENRVQMLNEAIDALDGSNALLGRAQDGEGLHNALVQIWVAGGLLALGGLVLVLLVPISSVVRCLRHRGTSELYAYATATVGWVAVVALNNAFWARFAWCVIALAVVAAAERTKEPGAAARVAAAAA
jgi:O-antigen ligase